MVITQVVEAEVDRLDYADMSHEPLLFLSGTFDGDSANWAIVEKEAHAIVMAVDRYDYLLFGASPFILYCDITT